MALDGAVDAVGRSVDAVAVAVVVVVIVGLGGRRDAGRPATNATTSVAE